MVAVQFHHRAPLEASLLALFERLELVRGKTKVYTSAEVLLYMWHIFIDVLDVVIRSGEGDKLIDISTDHWIHSFNDKLIPLLSSKIGRCGEGPLSHIFESVSECADSVAGVCSYMLSVDVEARRVSEPLGFLSPHNFHPSRFLAMSLVQCRAMESVFGRVLNRELQKRICSEWLMISTASTTNLLQDLKENMIASQCDLHELHVRGSKRLVDLEQVVVKRSRSSANVEKAIDIQTAQLHLAVKCRTAFSHMPDTLAEAVNLFSKEGHMELDSQVAALDSIVNDWTLTKHAMVVDQALDRVLATEIEAKRGSEFFGVGISTDESPPSGTRFCAFRFQVTQLYICWIPPKSTWSLAMWADTPPVRLQRKLLDIVHCPNKHGAALAEALGLQLRALNLTLHDIVSGTGDGGGEMEGGEGVHGLLQALSSSYVRRRCWAHLSWRCVDNGVSIMESHWSVQAVLTYLRESGTWLRLQAIAVQPNARGGLGITTEESALFRRMFSRAPPTIIEGRPETIVDAYKWLLPKEQFLARVCARDLEQRNIGQGVGEAVASLSDMKDRVYRRLNLDLVGRGLFLYQYVKKHKRLLPRVSFDDLVSRAIDILTNSEVDVFFCVVIASQIRCSWTRAGWSLIAFGFWHILVLMKIQMRWTHCFLKPLHTTFAL